MDSSAGDSLMRKTVDEAYAFLEGMVSNSYQWPMERLMARKPVGIHEVDVFTNLAAKVDVLALQLASMNFQGSTSNVESIVVANVSFQAIDLTQEKYHYMNNQNWSYNFNTNNNLPNYYNPGLWNHEKFSYAN